MFVLIDYVSSLDGNAPNAIRSFFAFSVFIVNVVYVDCIADNKTASFKIVMLRFAENFECFYHVCCSMTEAQYT